MIVKKVKGHFRDPRQIKNLVDYITTAQTPNGEEKCVHACGFNFFTTKPEQMAEEMLAVSATARPRKQVRRTPLQHWILSMRPMETPSIEEIVSASRMFLEDMGLSRHQAVMGIHINTENLHAHIAVSRINPMLEEVASQSNDVFRAQRALAHIEGILRLTPEKNAMFNAWNMTAGIAPNRHYKPSNSLSFAYASPGPVIAELPKNFVLPPLSSLRRKKDLWFYGNAKDASAVRVDDTLYFLSWAYKDTVADIKMLKDKGCRIIVPADVAPAFFDTRQEPRQWKDFVKSVFQAGDVNVFTGTDDAYVASEGIYVRKKPPALPLRFCLSSTPPWEFYKARRERLRLKNVSPVKIPATIALLMRMHSYERREIEECLRRGGLNSQYARHITRWLYDPKGSVELFRMQRQQKMMATGRSGKKHVKRQAVRTRLSLDTWGNLIINGKRKPDLLADRTAKRRRAAMWTATKRKAPAPRRIPEASVEASCDTFSMS